MTVFLLSVGAYILLVRYLNTVPNFNEKYFICDEIICL